MNVAAARFTHGSASLRSLSNPPFRDGLLCLNTGISSSIRPELPVSFHVAEKHKRDGLGHFGLWSFRSGTSSRPPCLAKSEER